MNFYTETMAHKIAVFLEGNNEFSSGECVFKLEDEYLVLKGVRVDDEGDIVFDLEHQ